ncbi:MAG: DUF448 domain-containing protein [Gaiella sp.]
MTTPTRTCAGCGRRAPQSEFVRFAARDGILTAGRALPGRGVYTCRARACFEAARARRAFARALRAPVTVGEPPDSLYTDALDG